MGNLYKNLLITGWLLVIVLCLQSCAEQGVQPEKQKIKFTLGQASAPGARVSEFVLPENARARISIAGSNGDLILSDHDVAVVKDGNCYVTDVVELTRGTYTITDFLIVTDTVNLYAAPKKGSEFASSITDALPYNFSIAENSTAAVAMHVIDARNADLQKFGYASSKVNTNTLSIAIYERAHGGKALTRATAELRQDKKLLKTLSLTASVNTITLGGDPSKPYTLTVYTPSSATTRTFTVKQLKKELAKNPLKLVLEPALVLRIQSYVDEGNINEDYFNFRMEGSGTVHINWGDGDQSAETLPFENLHEYFSGDYTAIVTGDINHVTDFAGFSYGSIISSITGLTHLTSLKIYDPSWGAVPIKVDLSNCKQLEKINVAKYGAPYEPIDLRTDFKLPPQHFITSFIFDAPSFDITREYISADELEVMANNIYNNVIARHLYNGKFYVNPVVTPSPSTQEKIDVLKNQYNWQVGFNDDVYYVERSASGRSITASEPSAKREQWLRERFMKGERIIERGRGVNVVN